MTTTASKRLRSFGLWLVAISAVAMLGSLVIGARFGHEFDWLISPAPLIWTVCFWIGIPCYLVGRFQRRP